MVVQASGRWQLATAAIFVYGTTTALAVDPAGDATSGALAGYSCTEESVTTPGASKCLDPDEITDRCYTGSLEDDECVQYQLLILTPEQIRTWSGGRARSCLTTVSGTLRYSQTLAASLVEGTIARRWRTYIDPTRGEGPYSTPGDCWAQYGRTVNCEDLVTEDVTHPEYSDCTCDFDNSPVLIGDVALGTEYSCDREPRFQCSTGEWQRQGTHCPKFCTDFDSCADHGQMLCENMNSNLSEIYYLSPDYHIIRCGSGEHYDCDGYTCDARGTRDFDGDRAIDRDDSDDDNDATSDPADSTPLGPSSTSGTVTTTGGSNSDGSGPGSTTDTTPTNPDFTDSTDGGRPEEPPGSDGETPEGVDEVRIIGSGPCDVTSVTYMSCISSDGVAPLAESESALAQYGAAIKDNQLGINSSGAAKIKTNLTRLQAMAVVCPVIEFPAVPGYWNEPLTVDIHCTIGENLRTVIAVTMGFIFSVMGIRVTLGGGGK